MANLSATGSIDLSLTSNIVNTESDGTVSQQSRNKTIISKSLASGVAVDEINRSWERKSWTLSSGSSEVIDIFDFDNLDIGAGVGRDGLGQLLLCSNLVVIIIKVESGAGSLEVEPDSVYGFTPIGVNTVANGGAIKIGGVIVKYAPDAEGFAITHRSSQRIKFTANGGNVVYSVRLGLRAAEDLPTTLGGLDLWMRADLDVSTGGARQLTLVNTEYFEIADNASLSTGNIDFSFAGWVYLDSASADMTLASKYNVSGNQREYRLFYENSSSRFKFRVSNDGASQTAATANNLGVPATGQWYFIVCEHDSVNDTISIQVNNGTLDETAYTLGVFDSTANFIMGNHTALGGPLNGRLARCGFWKRILTTAERTQLYNSGRSLFYNELPTPLLTNLISYWNLNEPSGNAIDSHSTNDLTDTNTVTAADGITPRVRRLTKSTSEFFEIADNDSLSPGDADFSFAGWIFFDGVTAFGTLLSKYNTTGEQREYRLYHSGTTGRVHFGVSGNGTNADVTIVSSSNLTPDLTAWHFVVVEHDAAANTVSIQIDNGAVDTEAHSTGAFEGTSVFQLGRVTYGEIIDGKMSRWGFWKRTLTTLDRTALYNSGRGLSHADLSPTQKVNLISFWDLNEIDGDAIDSEGTNDLTDINTVTSLLGPFEAAGPVIDGDPVSQWLDRSGSGKAFTQATLAKRPTYRASGINSLPSIEFDGVDDLLVLAEDYLSGSEGTVLAVIRFTANPSNIDELLTTDDEAGGGETVRLRAATPSVTALRVDNGVTNNSILGSSETVGSTDYLQVWMSDGTSYTIRLNGADETLSISTGADNGNWFGDVASQDNVVIGAAKNTSEVNFFDGKLSELIVYDHNLTTSELLTIETYLASRYGITLAS